MKCQVELNIGFLALLSKLSADWSIYPELQTVRVSGELYLAGGRDGAARGGDGGMPGVHLATQYCIGTFFFNSLSNSNPLLSVIKFFLSLCQKL